MDKNYVDAFVEQPMMILHEQIKIYSYGRELIRAFLLHNFVNTANSPIS